MPTGKAFPACESFLALCSVQDLMEEAKRYDVGEIPSRVLDLLDKEIHRFRALHYAAYEGLHTRPKHHYLFHVTESPRRLRFWLDCYVLERKHISIKAAVDPIANTTSMERSCIKAVLAQALPELRRWSWARGGEFKKKRRREGGCQRHGTCPEEVSPRGRSTAPWFSRPRLCGRSPG